MEAPIFHSQTVVRSTKRVAKSIRPSRDAQLTQQQILDAAEQEFSRHGLKGGRMNAIAEQAKVTTATLHYYFENKENLYKAVLQRPVDEVETLLGELNFDSVSPEEALKQIIRIAISNEAKNPQRQMLWFQEACQNQGAYFRECNVLNLHQHLLKVLHRGMAEGCFRPLEPFLALTHILSVCLFYFTVHENWKHLTPDIDRLSPKMIEEHTQEAIAFILAAVKRS
ncbi:TetR/AcrR family transcriptional regulator [Aetokthonos hydrillicola Thurmond2011]|jgi:TetR/AcrR family transcriptional regulator|uniref:TetR/AcrR family transcriptional regulator n=1 Tax=Aetokthonos hydrillicola Thurmond2011 TaxID=2712845 RepID=A0AAP5I615_9CYAN|nr:TetR/AcrR family transcriptional regulator [Aetokthonos hydrillicola]MBO3459486.1 TetR/AcrR family transcriptional regulator [Aetokthonos hydrillicola CCALA 1050]MBW4583849.1 TetR/AcrR family transcriptional regulator [Aetokthonos hydrillicola CCALA 1050]MDR9895456.1 TetR/AcrR family transcriptional regulator [Aetokthonos hydrillicola Thurmond2011]